MSISRPTSAKIIEHSHGMGIPTADSVRRRAHEIAIINGRTHFSEEDWRDARRELHGGHEDNSNALQKEMATIVSEHGMIICDVGHRVENLGPDDGENIAEELITEGMDEALHEQMLAARTEEPGEEDEL